MIRAFIAISVPDRILGGIERTTSRLRQLRLDARFTKTSSIHVTLKFLGAIEESLVDGISAGLEQCARATDSFSLSIERLGVFPNHKKPRVIWIGVREEPILVELQQRVDRKLETLGFEVEKRPFKPHLTLARLKSSRSLTELKRLMETEGPDLDIGSFKVNEIHLYQSILRPDGAVHRRLTTHALGTANLRE